MQTGLQIYSSSSPGKDGSLHRVNYHLAIYFKRSSIVCQKGKGIGLSFIDEELAYPLHAEGWL